LAAEFSLLGIPPGYFELTDFSDLMAELIYSWESFSPNAHSG